jgi:phosphoglycerate dehydrogenase-like enzyme
MKPLADCHVLVTPTSYGTHDSSLRDRLEAQVGRVTYNTTGQPLSSAQLQELLGDADGFIAGLDEVDAAAIQSAGCLQVIARYGVGVNNVDLDTARQRGIVVTNTPGSNSKSVAELTVVLILNLLRPVMQAAQETRQGGWPRLKGFALEGRTLGLVGLGSIGKEVARRLAGFDCQLLAYDPIQDLDFADDWQITYTSLEELLARADIVSLHLPALPETLGLVDERFLSRMKPGAWLVNTARGELVDEPALYTALVEGHLAGAALDVFAQEPPGAASPLLLLPQVLPTPHMGAHTDGATNAMGRMALEDCLAVLQGRDPAHRVV